MNNLGENTLWAVVKPKWSGYHPQQGPILVATDGRWTVNCFFGPPGRLNEPQEFQFLLLAAPPDADAALKEYLAKAKKNNNDFRAIELPDNAIVLTTLDVIRQQ